MAPSESTFQVLYEIALAIEPAATVEETARSAVSTYLQKLNCSGAGVFAVEESSDGRLHYDLVATLPEQSSYTERIVDATDSFPETGAAFDSAFPRVDEVASNTHRYTMELPDFGVLLLFRRGPAFDEQLVLSLQELNGKLANACNRVVVQQQYETQYRELFEDAPVMFALTQEVDGKPVITDCNREFVETLGYSREELCNRPLTDFYTEESKNRLYQSGYDQALTGELGTTERVFRTREGTEVTTQLRATPRRDRNGTVIGTNALYVDVTTLKRRNEQLAVLNRVLRHNLRNELAAIKPRLTLAKEDADDDLHEHLTSFEEQIENLISITEEADRIREVFDNTDLSQKKLDTCIERLIDRARDEFPGAAIDVSMEPVRIQATSTIDYALWELIENACEHAGESPQVSVVVRRADQTATVSINDDGPGIPEHERDILESGEETELEHGSGLGLWLVNWVVEISGGTISLDDETGPTVRLQVAEAES